jgi:hypothetical protein
VPPSEGIKGTPYKKERSSHVEGVGDLICLLYPAGVFYCLSLSTLTFERAEIKGHVVSTSFHVITEKCYTLL